MPKGQKKANLALAFLPVVSCFSPASASGYMSGNAGHGVVRIAHL
jgi:hypothetical protein